MDLKQNQNKYEFESEKQRNNVAKDVMMLSDLLHVHALITQN